jgi:hypothetical protein
VPITVGTFHCCTRIVEAIFVDKMAHSLATDVPLIFRQHCHMAAQHIAFTVIGPVNPENTALAARLATWDDRTGLAMFHEHTNDVCSKTSLFIWYISLSMTYS